MSGYSVGWNFPPLITRISEGRSDDTRRSVGVLSSDPRFRPTQTLLRDTARWRSWAFKKRPNGSKRAKSTSGAPFRQAELSAQRTEDGGIAIDPAELFRVFKPQQPDKRPVGQHATASLETSERPERIAQLSEPAGERAKADKAIAKCAALEESAKPWWRRLAHPRRPDRPEAPAGKTVEEDMAPALQEAPPQPDRLMPTCRSVVMPVLMSCMTILHCLANEIYLGMSRLMLKSAKRASLT